MLFIDEIWKDPMIFVIKLEKCDPVHPEAPREFAEAIAKLKKENPEGNIVPIPLSYKAYPGGADPANYSSYLQSMMVILT